MILLLKPDCRVKRIGRAMPDHVACRGLTTRTALRRVETLRLSWICSLYACKLLPHGDQVLSESESNAYAQFNPLIGTMAAFL